MKTASMLEGRIRWKTRLEHAVNSSADFPRVSRAELWWSHANVSTSIRCSRSKDTALSKYFVENFVYLTLLAHLLMGIRDKTISNQRSFIFSLSLAVIAKKILFSYFLISAHIPSSSEICISALVFIAFSPMVVWSSILVTFNFHD